MAVYLMDSHDRFIAALIEKVSQPSLAANPHCVSESTLYQIFGEIFESIPGPHPSKEKAKKRLEEIKLLTPIVLDEYPIAAKRSTRFYKLDISRRSIAQASPYELLQAYDGAGAICYFSALSFHGLTTQPPSHHHLAIPVAMSPKKQQLPAAFEKPKPVVPTKKVDPLGTWLFTYLGLRYYKTSKEARLFPGVQTRFLSATALIRITTLEQTLLDTLHKPLSCGGPAVVMEAWEQGLRRISEPKLAENLLKMDYLPVAQRLGYILANLELSPGSELKGVLQKYLTRLSPDNPATYQQLFPGIKYTRLHRPWMVYAPA